MVGHYGSIDGFRMAKVSVAERAFLAALVLVFYAFHQDLWFWRTARPFVFGFLPIGIVYHAAYSIAAAVLMAVLVRFAWPSELDPPKSSEAGR